MLKLRAIAIAIVLFSGSVLVASENYMDCMRNCKTKACGDCCMAQDNQVNGAKIKACSEKCSSTRDQCNSNCRKSRKCHEEYSHQAQEWWYPDCAVAFSLCMQKCHNARDPIPGKCPGEVKPQKSKP